MKIIAAVFADFDSTFLGGRSHLLTPLGSRTVLCHTLARLSRVQGLDGRCLFIRPRDKSLAEKALAATDLAVPVEILPLDDGQRRRRALLRSGRKWNLNAWRGSPLGTTWFDEFIEPAAVARLLNHYQCDAVLCLDGHQPALDPAISSAMVGQMRERANETAMLFTAAPPGLAGLILGRDAVAQLIEQEIPVGLLLGYRPEIPRSDPLTHASCLQIDQIVARTVGRFSADTRHSRELLAAAFAELGEDAAARQLCSYFRRARQDLVRKLPDEAELELTTVTPLPDSTLRPPGVPGRQLADTEAVTRLCRELADYDDQLLTLGGHGDPLLHPSFADICRRVRDAGVMGVSVSTWLTELSDEALEALFANRIDLLQVRLDANSPEVYRRVHRADCYDRVIANIERIERLRRARVSPEPIVVCSLTRCEATAADMEAFYDRWIRASGWAVIEGYNDFCGALPPDGLLHAGPPIREPCRRLGRSMMLLANGAAVLCGQDYRAERVVGTWTSEPVTDIWRSSAMRAARKAHAACELENYPACARCREWFRP